MTMKSPLHQCDFVFKCNKEPNFVPSHAAASVQRASYTADEYHRNNTRYSAMSGPPSVRLVRQDVLRVKLKLGAYGAEQALAVRK